jgi:acetylacetone-cleaving enzyme
MKQKAREEYVQIDEGSWAPFPDAFSTGGITWKLLHVSPEAGTWTTIFECRAGSSFNAHFHTGPGEYLLYKDKMEVRGGSESGGDTAIAPGYGF